MGNLPLRTHKREGLYFGSYSPTPSSGQLRLRGYPSFDMSLEDLHPFPPRRERWVRSEERDLEGSTILGMEVDQELEDICSGLLKFHYSDGLETFTENLHVQSRSTIGELLPDLITTFLPHEYQMAAIDGTQPTSVSLVQGKMERDLEVNEKPLEIVLDCSSRGLASPKFLFKCPLPTMGIPLTPHRTSRGNRHGGLDFSSEFGHNLSQPDHHTSMTSLGSGISISSSRSGKSKSTSSLTPKQKKKKTSLPHPHPHLGPGHHQSPSATPPLSRLHLSVPNDAPSPLTTSKTNRSSKAMAVSNFFSRSLRGKKKTKPVPLGDSPPNSLIQDSNDEHDDEEELEDYDDDYDDGPINFAADTSSSPHVNLERKFTLSTVMHIYFAEGKQAQVYKSVLVSEKATTGQLIKQALERYNMKNEDPGTFALFDVIGRWHDVTATLKTQLRYQANGHSKDNGRKMGANAVSTLPNLNILNASPLQHRAAVEEFVVCYSRELDPGENPYKMQFYLTAQEGFTRRFELRSKVNRDQGRVVTHFHEKSHSVDIMERPDEATPTPDILVDEDDDLESSGIFGDTVHRKRAKRNRLLHPSSMDSADPDTSINILDPAEDESEPVSSMGVSGRGRIGGLGKIYSSKHVVRGSRIVQAEDHEDSEIPIAMNTSFAPNFSKLGYSSPDSGVEFQKGARQSNSNKSSVSSEQSDTGNNTGGAGATSEPHPPLTLCPGNLDSAFLLSLRLCDPHKESLVYKLNEDSTEILVNSPDTFKQCDSSVKGKVFLSSNEGDNEKQQLLCTVCRCPVSTMSFHGSRSDENLDSADPMYEYSLLQGSSSLPVFHNGELMTDCESLRHGDLIAIGSTYLFMFQDYTATSKELACRLKYSWRPQVCSPIHAQEERRKSSSSRETIVEASTKTLKEVQSCDDQSVSTHQGGDSSNISLQPQVLVKPISSTAAAAAAAAAAKTDSPTATRVSYYVSSLQEPQKITVTSANQVESSIAVREPSSLATTATVTRVPVTSGLSDEESTPHRSPGASRRKPHSPRSSHKTRAEKLKSSHHHHHRSVGKACSLPLPKDRKLVFSFKVTEEDKLLKHVVSESRKGKEAASCLRNSPCKLAPAYILAMCTEYSSMTSGPQAVARFVQKATDRIQEVVWECTNRLSTWQPNMEELQKPLQQKMELFPLLEPVFFWLANSLEYYHFLDSQRASLQLDAEHHDSTGNKRKKDKKRTHRGKVEEEEEEEEEDNPMEILYSILVYIYQQAFYPISKVLYQSLPLMLESCIDQEGVEPLDKPDSSQKPIVIGQAVEFLQALLDMMTEQSIHLEVISQFFANVFFFVNAAMLNALLEQGGELGLFQYYSGLILRENLDLFEGWACQVGFKDAVLRYLARFSGAIDFLATPTERLLQLNWSELCGEFPVLHPAQLHFLLSQYLLPVPSAGLPRHWTPTEEDAALALSRECLMESFDGHPGFHLPSSNYVLNLNHPPPESEDFQDVLEALHASLHKNGRNTSITTDVLMDGGTISIDRTSPTPPEMNGSCRTRRRGTEPGSEISNSLQQTLRDDNIGSSTESQEDLLTVTWRNLENSQCKKPTSRSPSLDGSSPSHKPHSDKGERSPVISKFVGKPLSSNKVETARLISDSYRPSSKEKHPMEGHENHVRIYPSTNSSDVPQPGGWMENDFPQGSRVVTIPRGDKGFGLVLAEKKVAGGGDSRLFVQQLSKGSTACGLLGLAVGDQVLAIEGEPLGGADYRTAQKYLKEAEDEITLTLAPRTGKN